MRKAESMRTNTKKLDRTPVCCGFTERKRETSLARREVVDALALSSQIFHERRQQRTERHHTDGLTESIHSCWRLKKNSSRPFETSITTDQSTGWLRLHVSAPVSHYQAVRWRFRATLDGVNVVIDGPRNYKLRNDGPFPLKVLCFPLPVGQNRRIYKPK